MKKNFFILIFLLSFLCVNAFEANAEQWHVQSLLPKSVDKKISISGEFRYRLEYRDDFDFDDVRDDRDVFHLFRTRLNFEYKPLPFLKGFIQGQDARIISSEFLSDKPFRDSMDLRQGYVEMYDAIHKGFGLKVGRQELSYGSERLLGAFNWSNIAQSFDAAKVFYQFELVKLDIFMARKVLVESSRVLNEWDDKDNLVGFYAAAIPVIKDHTVDVYYFFRDSNRSIVFGPSVGSSDMSESTMGGRFLGKQPWGLDYQLEGAYQFGDFGVQDISAWMFIGLVGYNFQLPWTPRVTFEFDHASGDKRSGDGKRNTFDNLFPANHLFYGFMDLIGLQNINDLVFTMSGKPLPKLMLKMDTHFFFLDETTDSLYSAARFPTRTSKISNASHEVGQEIDFTLNYQLRPEIATLLGYSYFFSGDFLSESGSDDNASFFYVQLTVGF